MKGFKLIRKDWTCDGETYAVGKTVAMKDKPVLYGMGLDFCTDMKDCLLYDDLYSDSHMCEVEAGGEVAMSAADTDSYCWTNSLRIVREIPFKELMKNIIDLELLKMDPWLFLYLEDPSPETCLAAVQQKGTVLRFVENKTPEICMAAVQQDGYALYHVKDQTPELCLAAVQQDGRALRYVEDKTPELCMAAVKQNGWALEYVKEQTPEICLAAVQQNETALDFVKDPELRARLAARDYDAVSRMFGRGSVNGTNRIDTSRRSHMDMPVNSAQERMSARNTATPGGEPR